MKALTLWQPWASLVAFSAKTVETRSWTTDYRGPLAIHAGTKQVHHGHFLLLARNARVAGLITAEEEQAFRALDVPFGAVVATCHLVDVVPVEAICWTNAWHDWRHVLVMNDDPAESPLVGNAQRPYGDYSPGRFAWLLGDIKQLEEPVPARGRQRLWWPPELS